MIKPMLGSKRIYVLDTNVLIHDPQCFYNFEEHDVVIPIPVLEELDRLKIELSDRGRQARATTRGLDKIVDECFIPGTDGNSAPLPSVGENKRGVLSFLPSSPLKEANLDNSIVDNQILSVAYQLQSKYESSEDVSVIMVTNDTNMRVKCAAVGLYAESYRNDCVLDDSDLMPSGYWECPSDRPFFDQFDSVECVTGQAGGSRVSNRYTVTGNIVSTWHPGMFVFSSDDGKNEFLVTHIDGETAQLEQLTSYYNGSKVFGINAKDPFQNYALNVLMNPDIDLVTLTGPAGTGKTFLVMAAALELVFDKDTPYEKVIITRETIELGESSIGFLPGTEAEKLDPWMGGFHDNIEQLADMEDKHKDTGMQFINHRLHVCSIGFLRGRSINNALIIIDEVQNISPKSIKGIVTRAGEGSKIVCMGNLAQIDTPYLNAGSTGLAHLVQNFRNCEHSGHITLKAIRRSRLAEYAEQAL